MNLKNTFKKVGSISRARTDSMKKEIRMFGKEPEVPKGLLKKCNSCKSAVITEEVKDNYYIYCEMQLLFSNACISTAGDGRG